MRDARCLAKNWHPNVARVRHVDLVKGDLFEDAKDLPPPHAFAFAADCSGAMNKGIAVAFKKRWPAFAEAYRAHTEGGKMQPGDVFMWRAHAPGVAGPGA